MIKGSLGRGWLVSFDLCCPSDWPIQSPAWFWWIMTWIFQASLIALKRIPKGRCVFIYPEDPGIVHADDLLGVLFHTTFRCLIQRFLRHHQQYGYESPCHRSNISMFRPPPGRVRRLCRPNVTIDVTACWMVQSTWSVEKNTLVLLRYIWGWYVHLLAGGGMISVCLMLWFGWIIRGCFGWMIFGSTSHLFRLV